MTPCRRGELLKKHNPVLTLCPGGGIKAANLRLTGFPWLRAHTAFPTYSPMAASSRFLSSFCAFTSKGNWKARISRAGRHCGCSSSPR
ncbi:hypothetical protein AGR7B_Cc50085 [Agrobacterium deltaense RV3]|nr:hypothetical protein AGR7B_Cc50085 [Agrobacterium deltaense RV3]